GALGPGEPVPAALTPTKLPLLRLPVAGGAVLPTTWMPSIWFPEAMLRAPGVVPPMMLFEELLMWMPSFWFGWAAVPCGLVPTKLPAIVSPPPCSSMPLRLKRLIARPLMVEPVPPAPTSRPSALGPALAPFNSMRILALSPLASVFMLAPGSEWPLIVIVTVSVGRAPLPVPPTLIVCTVPLALILKLMVSLTPKVPGFWLEMSVSAPALPLLIAWMASRSATDPSLATLSSATVFTVIVAGV